MAPWTPVARPPPRLRNQAAEGENKDGLDHQHQPHQQPLPAGSENNKSGQRQESPQCQCVDGEPDGDACAPDPGPETETEGFPAGMAGNAVRRGRSQFVELFPRVLVLSRHPSIVPKIPDRRREGKEAGREGGMKGKGKRAGAGNDNSGPSSKMLEKPLQGTGFRRHRPAVT